MTTFRCRDTLKRSSGGRFEISEDGPALPGSVIARRRLTSLHRRSLSHRPSFVERRLDTLGPSLAASHVPAPARYRSPDQCGLVPAATRVIELHPAVRAPMRSSFKQSLPKELRLAIPNPQRRAGFDRNRNCVPRPVEDRRIRSRNHGASNGTAR